MLKLKLDTIFWMKYKYGVTRLYENLWMEIMLQ